MSRKSERSEPVQVAGAKQLKAVFVKWNAHPVHLLMLIENGGVAASYFFPLNVNSS